jgi:hypothetical protein
MSDSKLKIQLVLNVGILVFVCFLPTKCEGENDLVGFIGDVKDLLRVYQNFYRKYGAEDETLDKLFLEAREAVEHISSEAGRRWFSKVTESIQYRIASNWKPKEDATSPANGL